MVGVFSTPANGPCSVCIVGDSGSLVVSYVSVDEGGKGVSIAPNNGGACEPPGSDLIHPDPTKYTDMQNNPAITVNVKLKNAANQIGVYLHS